ncbi:sodium/glutamate symporter [Nesterenkonia ebinurensis]|uniref:sodium/glutamate symporter n=1 Tax=Nesterenkonia ebinurensis TaxID=2608252 RepID=UPI00123CFEAE|nr:sodium/glutamate symporter [Nesterenkonia ebinurensis]
MPDIMEIDSGMLNSLLLALGGLSILLLLGVILRMAIPLLRRFFIPASLIGGIIGLIAGPHFIGVVPEDMMGTWSALAGVLIAIVFAPLLLGQELPSFKQAAQEAGPHIFMSYFSSFAQVGVPALLLFFIFEPFFNTNPLFSTIFEASWSGGHGTAAGMEEAYTALGWADGSSIALGSATFGLVFGVVMGMILLNIVARRGQLINYDPSASFSESDILRDSDVSQDTRSFLKSSSLNNLAFHFCLIAIAVLIGFILKHFVDMIVTGVPIFPLAMLGGLIVHLVIRPTPLYRLVDKPTLNSIAGIALDFLVVSAVAAISIPVLIANWVPFTVITLVMAGLCVFIFFWVGPRIFRKHWVENMIPQFGSMTGVVAIGLLLLRAADPHMKTSAYRGYAMRAPFSSPFVGGGIITALFPIMVAQYGNFWIGLGCLALCLLLMGLAMAIGMWKSPKKHAASSP